MLEKEKTKEKEDNLKLKAKLESLEVKVTLIEQQLESEKKHNESLSKQYQISF